MIPDKKLGRRTRPGELPGAAVVCLNSFDGAEHALTGAIRLVLTAQGALDRMRRALSRAAGQARQADDEALAVPARVALHRGFTEQVDDMARLAETTEHAGARMLDGSLAAGVTYVVDMDGIWEQRVSFQVPDCRPGALGLGADAGLGTPQEARQAAAVVGQAAVRLQAIRLELSQARERLAEAVEGLSRPTMLAFVQLHGAALEHLALAAAAMGDGRAPDLQEERVLVCAILDIISSYSLSIAPGMCDNLGVLLAHLKQQVQQASAPEELEQVAPILAELQQTWSQELKRPLVVPGPNGRRHRITTSAMRVQGELEMVTGG